jgi:hypothetical protein
MLLLLTLCLQDSVEEWIEKLDDDRPQVRAAAAEELIGRGRAALPLARTIMAKGGAKSRSQIERVLTRPIHEKDGPAQRLHITPS